MWYNICVTILKFNQGFQSPSFGGTDWILEELSVLIGIELDTWGHWGLVQPEEECCAEPTEADESESEVTRSCLTLWDPLDRSLPGSSVCGISRQEYWSGLPLPSPGELPDPGIESWSAALQAHGLCQIQQPWPRSPVWRQEPALLGIIRTRKRGSRQKS